MGTACGEEELAMVLYLDVALFLNFAVDLLLLLFANRLCGYPSSWKRVIFSALLGGVYGGLCLLPGLRFLGNMLWRTVCLCLMAWIAFGSNRSAIRRGALFVLLSMALGGMAVVLGRGGLSGILLGVGCVVCICLVGFGGRAEARRFIPVELRHKDKCLHLTALEDTGNSLRDPITGSPVLVVGANVAMQLLGLTRRQLEDPLGSVKDAPVPGLRLVPYHSVGKSGGLLLAMRLKEVRIGNWKGSSLVAFAPEGLDQEGMYQALTGGMA